MCPPFPGELNKEKISIHNCRKKERQEFERT
jgi:hypothetical protein